MIKLLTGMYRPSAGRITLDGLDLAEISADRWRSATTGAFQDYVRFFMTLGDGVGAGDLPRIDDRTALASAMERAGADEGAIKETGDHDALMASGGGYAELFALQAAGYA